jgi:metal-responsive CopG/Arc/MetJ family transcriptional regulator
MIDMHMHVGYIYNMRTTITLAASLRQKLVNEAAKRNIKGYSTIIEDALEKYFSQEDSESTDDLKSLRGCMTHEEFLEASKMIEEGRANWKM